jgi:hypothetical protein
MLEKCVKNGFRFGDRNQVKMQQYWPSVQKEGKPQWDKCCQSDKSLLNLRA